MKSTFYKYFIPHEANNYHPHILHTKRAIFYSAVFLTTKVIMILFVILLPMEVFGLPDILAEEQRQIIALTNQVRADHQRLTLAVSSRMDTSAQYKADDMAANDYFAHSFDNKTVADWLKKAGYNYGVAGENLAVGYSTAEEVVAAWVNSPTHYANLVDSDYQDLGVGLTSGYYEGQPTVFVAQHFASPVVFPPSEGGRGMLASGSLAVKKPVIVQVPVPPSLINSPLEGGRGMLAVSTSSSAPTSSEEITIPLVVASSVDEQITSSTIFALAGEDTTSSVLAVKELSTTSTPADDAVTTTATVVASTDSNPTPTQPLINANVGSTANKYVQAKSTLTPITNIFNIARIIYLIAMVFFIWALALKIFIEFKKQHPHVILQTSALITLLFLLWKF